MDYSCSDEEKEDDSSSGHSNFDVDDDHDFAYKVEIIITENTAACHSEIRRVNIVKDTNALPDMTEDLG